MPAKKQSAFMTPVEISAQLAKVVGPGPLPRTEITKNIWEYIRKHKLQDTKNKRQINTGNDANLKAVCGGKASVDMFQLTKHVNEHIVKKPALSTTR